MYYKKIQNDTGAYVDSENERCDLACADAIGTRARGWTHFDSIDDCLNAWGLTYDPLPEPEPEDN